MKYILFLILLSCNSIQNEKKQESEFLTLGVSKEHRNYFFDFPKEIFSENEMKEIFKNRHEISNEVCEMIYGKKSLNQKKIEEFIKAENFKKEPFKNWGHPIPKLIVGCWNFFRLNDVKPNLDFEFIQEKFQSEKKDCYSVGFLQIYLMQSILSCDRITMIDIDWRILEAHFNLISLFKKNELDSETNLLESLKKITVSWVARFDKKPMEKETKANLDTFCYVLHQEMCKKNLIQFQNKFKDIKSIHLRLSSLHDFLYDPNSKNTKIIYLSNAIDDLYTSKEQFQKLIDSVYSSLAPDQKAIFIHHSAGWSFFGVYELQKTNEAPKIKQICKDKYKTTPVEIDKAREYITHFERFSNLEKTNLACSK